MHPQVFQKLCSDQTSIPYLNESTLGLLSRVCHQLHQRESFPFWGIVSHAVKYRGHNLAHCYNFGNTTVDFPWKAQFVNYGKVLDTMILQAGTNKRNTGDESLLSGLLMPYLVLQFEADAMLTEHLQEGMLLVESGQAPPQRQQYDVVFPQESIHLPQQGLLAYQLLHNIPFTAEPLEYWVAPGAVSGYNCARLRLEEPVILEPGWPVLLLDKEIPRWGVVAA